MTQDTHPIRDASAEINGQFPAFPVSLVNPVHGHQDSANTWQFPGLSIRDYFAAKALPVAWSSIFNGCASAPGSIEQSIASLAYQLADAMLKARAEGGAA